MHASSPLPHRPQPVALCDHASSSPRRHTARSRLHRLKNAPAQNVKTPPRPAPHSALPRLLSAAPPSTHFSSEISPARHLCTRAACSSTLQRHRTSRPIPLQHSTIGLNGTAGDAAPPTSGDWPSGDCAGPAKGGGEAPFSPRGNRLPAIAEREDRSGEAHSGEQSLRGRGWGRGRDSDSARAQSDVTPAQAAASQALHGFRLAFILQ